MWVNFASSKKIENEWIDEISYDFKVSIVDVFYLGLYFLGYLG